MRKLIKVYKVLSDESRLKVLALLGVRACCVCEVMQAMEISQSKASRILSSLYDAGLLVHEKDGLWSLYSIDWQGMDINIRNLVETTINTLKTNKTASIEIARLKRAKRVGPANVCKIEKQNIAG